MMNKLQYLDIYSKGYYYAFLQFQRNLYLPQGLESLPNELKYLRWAYYPLESLPSKFTAENLVVLNLQCSQVKKLWHEEKVINNACVNLIEWMRYVNLFQFDIYGDICL